MRALKLIRGKKPSIMPVMFAQKPEVSESAEPKVCKTDLVWQPRPEWLRKPARQNHWN